MPKPTKDRGKKASPAVQITVSLDGEKIYPLVFKFRKDNGLSFDQDAIRMLIAVGLRQVGYLKK